MLVLKERKRKDGIRYYVQKKQDSKKDELIKAIIEAYKPETATDVNHALKDLFGPMFEAMLQGEMTSHLGYENNTRDAKATTNRRNGYSKKNCKNY